VKGRDDVQETAQTLFLQTTGGVTQKEVWDKGFEH
jgi:hypothetical protein